MSRLRIIAFRGFRHSFLAWLVFANCSRIKEHAVCTVPMTEAQPDLYWVQPLRTSEGTLSRVPQGCLLLIRRGDAHVFAVKFTNVRGAPNQGQMLGCAHYEVYDFGGARPKPLCAGEVSDLSSRGVHPVVWNTGHQGIPCLPKGASYEFPTQLWLRSTAEVAVSQWSAPEAVDIRNPSLRWYGYRSGDANESPIHIPIAELPK